MALDPDAILIEEYCNFDRHNLAAPKAGTAVGLDVRWRAEQIEHFSREAVSQYGLVTVSRT